MRVSLLSSVSALLLFTACADAPITPDQLEADGVLRGAPRQQSEAVVSDQAAFSAARGTMQRASVVALSSVLATQPVLDDPGGALDNRDHFVASVGVIHLHVRADGIESPRPVLFRWIHGDQAIVVPGTLESSGALQHAASVEVRPHQVGPWRVEVATAGSSSEPPEVIYSREFTVE